MTTAQGDLDDAYATLEFTVRDAVAQSALHHRITPPAAEALVSEIMRRLLDPSVLWAVRVAAEGGDVSTEEEQDDAATQDRG